MKILLTIVVGLLAPVGVYVAVGYSWMYWDHLHTFYPTPENESAFLRTYTPKPLVESFKSQQYGSYSGGEAGGEGAGKHFVTHDGQFDYAFTMDPANRALLMAAADSYTSARLVRSGARILNHTGHPTLGFHFE